MQKNLHNVSDINCQRCDKKREYIGLKDKYLLLECSHCNAWVKKDSEELTKRIRNTFEFCDKDIILFCC